MQIAQIHHLPVARHAHAAASADPAAGVLPPNRRTSDIDVNGVAALIGMAGRPRRAIIGRIRHLIDRAGFPLPKTPRFVDGRHCTGGAAVHAKSIWARDLVDHWFDGTLPPAAVAARTVARRGIVRVALAQAARAMVA